MMGKGKQCDNTSTVLWGENVEIYIYIYLNRIEEGGNGSV